MKWPRQSCGHATAELLQAGRQPRINAGERTAVGFVLAVFVGVGRAAGERLHLGRHIDQSRRKRQLPAQQVHFGQVVAQRDLALAAQGLDQGVGADIGVAIAVAANPLAHAQKAVHGVLAQLPLQIGIDLGNLAQKGGFVIRQRVFDFIGHRELAIAQQARLPQLGHAGAQQGFVGGQLARGERVLGAVVELCAHLDVVAHRQQLGDIALGVQNALALDLGRVGSEHRGHIAAGQGLGNGLGRNAGPAQARQGDLDAALLRVARALVHGAAADVVAVFGQVGQVAEIGEGPDHAHRLVARQRLEQLLEGAVGLLVGIAAKSH